MSVLIGKLKVGNLKWRLWCLRTLELVQMAVWRTVRWSFHLRVSKIWQLNGGQCDSDVLPTSAEHKVPSMGVDTMPPSIWLHDSQYWNDSTMLFNNSLDIWGLFAPQHHCILSRAVVTFSNLLRVNVSNHTFKDIDNDISISAAFLKCRFSGPL